MTNHGPHASPASPAVLAVIMAGGGGERLWPLSTPERPKPFINLVGGESLLRQAVARAAGLAGPDRVHLVITSAMVPLVREELPELPADRLIVEPFGMDTAPCVALAAAALARRYEDPVLAIMPADHYVPDRERFIATLDRAVAAAAAGYIVTLGLRPDRPETGFGYIELGAQLEGLPGVHQVARFVEKPDAARAAEMVAAGRFLWNAGIFVARAARLAEAFRQHLPAVGEQLPALAEAAAAGDLDRLALLYRDFPRISLDFGVIEKEAGGLAVVPADFAWDDVGAWTALARLLPAGGDGNVVLGPATAVAARDTIVYTDAPQTLVVGTGGVVVARAEDRVLVCGREHAAELKAVLKALPATAGAAPGAHPAAAPPPRGEASFPEPRVVGKPWGREVWWAHSPHYLGKLLEVKAGHRLSLQYHRQKHETLYVLAGEGSFTVGDRVIAVRPGTAVALPPGTVHRIEATTDLTLLEVSTPHPDDVVRLEDAYGRVPGGGIDR